MDRVPVEEVLLKIAFYAAVRSAFSVKDLIDDSYVRVYLLFPVGSKLFVFFAVLKGLAQHLEGGVYLKVGLIIYKVLPAFVLFGAALEGRCRIVAFRLFEYSADLALHKVHNF